MGYSYPNRIVKLREQKGWRQRDLVRAAHATQTLISRLERFESPLTSDWISRLSDALQCYPWELLAEWETADPVEVIMERWAYVSAEDRQRLLMELPPEGFEVPPHRKNKPEAKAPEEERKKLVEFDVSDKGTYHLVLYYRNHNEDKPSVDNSVDKPEGEPSGL